MLYSLEQGPTEQLIIETCIRERTQLPAAILNAPVLLLGLDLYYTAFLDLTTDRPQGFSEGAIPWSAIENYCDRRELDDEQREDMHYHLKRMDVAYLEHRAKQSKPDSKPASKTKRKGA